MPGSPTIVLVHGGFVDGSGWEGVYKILKKGGYDVLVVQNPTNSLADDVAVTKRVIAKAKGDVILVGHSYGGVVVSEAGNDPKVRGLVYIAAFAPDRGESVSSLIANPAPGAPGRRHEHAEAPGRRHAAAAMGARRRRVQRTPVR
jgi:pimeloyl-ACP methyl ester carboxylesterase